MENFNNSYNEHRLPCSNSEIPHYSTDFSLSQGRMRAQSSTGVIATRNQQNVPSVQQQTGGYERHCPSEDFMSTPPPMLHHQNIKFEGPFGPQFDPSQPPPPLSRQLAPPPLPPFGSFPQNTRFPPTFCSQDSSTAHFPPGFQPFVAFPPPEAKISRNDCFSEDINICSGTNSSDWAKLWVEDAFMSVKVNKQDPCLKVRDVQVLLCRFSKKLNQLKDIRKSMIQFEEKDYEWEASHQLAEELKKELFPLIEKIKNADFVTEVKAIITKRRQKRKRSRLAIKRNKEVLQKASKYKEEQIDKWRSKIIEEEAAKLQEENMKKEADCILGEVRSKHQETLKFQKLLCALETLRKARINKGESHGYISSTLADKCFEKLTGEVNRMLTLQTDHYKLEEQTLRVMMEESPNIKYNKGSFSNNKTEIETKEDLSALKELLFGKEHPENSFCKSFLAAEESLEVLVNRRIEWDRYLVDWEAPLSSSVPLPWVRPPSSPNCEWKKYKV